MKIYFESSYESTPEFYWLQGFVTLYGAIKSIHEIKAKGRKCYLVSTEDEDLKEAQRFYDELYKNYPKTPKDLNNLEGLQKEIIEYRTLMDKHIINSDTDTYSCLMKHSA